MNILLVTLGSAGDVLPIAGLAIALQERGHRVTVITSGFFKDTIENLGIEFIEIGSRETLEAIMKNPDVWNPRKGLEVLLRQGFLPAVRQVYEIIAGHASEDTIVVSSVLMYGARVACEKLNIPLVTLQLQPAGFWSIAEPAVMPIIPLHRFPSLFRKILFTVISRLLDRMAGPKINGLRTDLGMPKVRHIFSEWAHSPLSVIGLFPEWYATPAPDWPPHTVLTGFIRFDRPFGGAVPDEAIDFLAAGDPPVVITPGTGMQHADRFFQASIEACRLLKRRAILLTLYRDHLPGRLPEGIAHFEYLPFSEVFPRAAALIHHGGIGTTAQALAAGIPQLVVPMNYDQPDNAARLVRLGVGASLSPRKFNGKKAAEKLEYLLTSRKVREQCRHWADKIDFKGAVEETCRAIEQLK